VFTIGEESQKMPAMPQGSSIPFFVIPGRIEDANPK
jgi:hypothetical protein